MPTASRLPPLRNGSSPTRNGSRRSPEPAADPVAGSAADRGPGGAKRTWRSRLRGGACGASALALTAAVIAGVVLRLTVRDGFAPLAPVFYALSVPVLVLLGLAAALCTALACGLTLTLKRCVLLAALGLLGALNAAIFLFQDSTFDDRPRVVLWNVARGVAGWDGVADALAANNPTLAVLIESGGQDDDSEAFLRERFDDHFVARPGGGITILSRGRFGREELFQLPGGGVAAAVDTQVAGELMSVLAVDLPASPTRDRGAPLRRIAELAVEMATRRPTLVMGDFNTPPDSVHFATLRRAGFHHAFERHGSGYAATWPVPAPVLHLDHVWMSAGFDAGETWHGWTAHSDHRPVLAPMRVAPAKFDAARSLARTADVNLPE